MKNHILAIAFILISTIALGQRKIPMATRYCPKMENQITKEDSLRDESGLEYAEREFQGAEEDTAAMNAHFRRMEELQKEKMIPEEKPDGENLEEMYWMDARDIKKEDENKKEAAKPKSNQK